jgi:hypothetical protein
MSLKYLKFKIKCSILMMSKDMTQIPNFTTNRMLLIKKTSENRMQISSLK